MPSARVALGVQGAQTETSIGRGLSRYVMEQAQALVRLRPGAVAQISHDPLLPLPQSLADLAPAVQVAPSSQPPAGEGTAVYHVMSPFEFLVLDRVWPIWAQAREVGLVVTVPDLIPLTYADRYLNERHARRWYLPRLELARAADAIVAISESAAHEAERLLGIPEERLFVSYLDCGPGFTPGADREEAFRRACEALPELRPGFLVYVGGMDYRKNVTVLLEAYAAFEPDFRRRHQLVIAGRHLAHETALLEAELERRAIRPEVLLTGYIPDSVLADLYRSCATLVLPSLHEGFGLTVLEAMRCGAAALVSDTTSLPELVTWPEARFDPRDAPALNDLLRRVLTDDALRDSLRAQGLAAAGRFSWERSAAVVAEAHAYAAEKAARRS